MVPLRPRREDVFGRGSRSLSTSRFATETAAEVGTAGHDELHSIWFQGTPFSAKSNTSRFRSCRLKAMLGVLVAQGPRKHEIRVAIREPVVGTDYRNACGSQN